MSKQRTPTLSNLPAEIFVDALPELAQLEVDLLDTTGGMAVHHVEMEISHGAQRWRHLPQMPGISDIDRSYLFEDTELRVHDLRFIRLLERPLGPWYGTSDVFTDDDIAWNPFYREFLHAQGIENFAVKSRFFPCGRCFTTYMTFPRGFVPAKEAPRAIMAYELLAYQIARRQDALHTAGIADPTSLSDGTLPQVGVVELDRFGRILDLDRLGQDIFAFADTLQVIDGQVAAFHPASDVQIAQILTAAQSGKGLLAPVRLRDRNGRHRLRATAIPPDKVGTGTKSIMLLLEDLMDATPVSLSVEILKQDFGFTGAECDLGELLVEGRIPAEIRLILGISSDTLRKRRAVMRDKLGIAPAQSLDETLHRLAFRP
ncbi:helix-turn-helix transcriptional regulator [Roseobacter weihaiensis]|uniref:helix-turn-helix transcriptional regulator n=1 Tax=Roseobacter weihaiensis TaxID=2763262 RepID=UPI001D0B2157|nr:hypothetical protein [Roseobacter sp. H9]